MKNRIDYIDTIKGVVIFGVVWVHTAHPNWLTPLLVNTIFFFLSGIFFKRKPIGTFLKEKVQSILIPFSFFYLISYPFRMIVHYWDHRTLESFDWLCILDVFSFSAKTDYMFVNVPLWFLICLFVIQVLYYFVSFLDKRIIGIIALLCLLFKEFFLSVPSFFMINAAFYYISFFALGNLLGRPLMEKLREQKFQKYSLISSVVLLATFLPSLPTQNEVLNDLFLHFRLFELFFVIMSMGSILNDNKNLELIRFYGRNSLIILGVHIIPLIFFGRIAYAILGDFSATVGFFLSLGVMAVMIWVIRYFSNTIPFLVGKRKLE